METETQQTDTRSETRVTVTDCGPGHVTVRAPRDQSMVLSLEDLQVIVQAAYDQHDLLADPSYATEADLAELAADPERRRYCSCGLPGCSDPDPFL